MSSDDEGEAGAYVLDGFVVAEDDDDPACGADAAGDTSALVDVDERNIVTGKRRRRATRTIYEDEEFGRTLAETMLADVPDHELGAALDDDCSDAVILTDDEGDDEHEHEGGKSAPAVECETHGAPPCESGADGGSSAESSDVELTDDDTDEDFCPTREQLAHTDTDTESESELGPDAGDAGDEA